MVKGSSMMVTETVLSKKALNDATTASENEGDWGDSESEYDAEAQVAMGTRHMVKGSSMMVTETVVSKKALTDTTTASENEEDWGDSESEYDAEAQVAMGTRHMVKGSSMMVTKTVLGKKALNDTTTA